MYHLIACLTEKIMIKQYWIERTSIILIARARFAMILPDLCELLDFETSKPEEYTDRCKLFVSLRSISENYQSSGCS